MFHYQHHQPINRNSTLPLFHNSTKLMRCTFLGELHFLLCLGGRYRGETRLGKCSAPTIVPLSHLLIGLLLFLLLNFIHYYPANAETRTPPQADPQRSEQEEVPNYHNLTKLIGLGLKVTPQLPALFGFDQPKHYLLFVQNNHELRGTGGFLSAIGQVTIENGQLTKIDFIDSYDFIQEGVEYPWAPDPMQKYMGIELLLMRDVNWSPDLPTTAQIARTIYRQDTGILIDGIVTVDLRAVELLFEAFGTLELPEAGTTLSSKNIIEQFKQFWDRPIDTELSSADGFNFFTSHNMDWWESRKAFVPLVAQAILGRLQAGQIDYLALAQAMQTALDERSIQVWFHDPMLATQMAQFGWDGALPPIQDSDFLSLIDTNMGYNKVDAILSRTLHYTVQWSEEPQQPAIATATISYTHPLELPDHLCESSPYYGFAYDDMMARCYFDYVRLYVPAGSTLLEIEGVESDSVSSRRGPKGSQVFAGYFVLKPGERHTVTFHYQLPSRLQPESYHLIVQKQAGASPLPFEGEIGERAFSTIIYGGSFKWGEATKE